MAVQSYFLGANSAKGFYSLYGEFCPPKDGNYLWVIKGGPGCGKSSFMRKIGKAAEEKGYDVEYVLCSGDPDSVDGVYIPQKKLGYVDGTAPHVLDVPYPGAYGLYLDLGQFYNRAELTNHAERIMAINTEYKALYKKAYAVLSAIHRPTIPSAVPACKKRFHTAISCNGTITISQAPLEKNESFGELNELLGAAKGQDTAFMHPLWPDVVMSFYSAQDGIIYHAPCSVPPCESAVLLLKEAKILHDKLEEIYNPNVNFDGVYNLAAEHIRNYL